jgi:hypothetical protein
MGDAPPVLLLDRVRDRIRLKHYSLRTEQAYCDWIRRFIIFHGKRHPSGLGAAEVEAFLTSLAVAGRVAASTQNQAKSALLFLYREVLGAELPCSMASRRRRRRCGCQSSSRLTKCRGCSRGSTACID